MSEGYHRHVIYLCACLNMVDQCKCTDTASKEVIKFDDCAHKERGNPRRDIRGRFIKTAGRLPSK